MEEQRLKILFDIILEPEEDDEDIRSVLISEGDDPDEILQRANNFIDEKLAQIKLQEGKNRQNKASQILKNIGGSISNKFNNDISLNGVGFAFRKQDAGSDQNNSEILNQAEKLEQLKKLMGNGNEHTGKS
jgi:endonuclease III